MALAENKKIYHEYEILEEIEAGLSLQGFEAKAISTGKASLKGGRVILRGEEAFLVGVTISPYQAANTPKDYEPDRIRKLLLHKKELAYLNGKIKEKGLTIVPIRLYNKGRNIKLGMALVRGKKKYDKRETLKKKTADRDAARSLKNY